MELAGRRISFNGAGILHIFPPRRCAERPVTVVSLEEINSGREPLLSASDSWVTIGTPRVTEKTHSTPGYVFRTYHFPVSVESPSATTISTASLLITDPFHNDHVGTIPIEVRPEAGPLATPSRIDWSSSQIDLGEAVSKVVVKGISKELGIEVTILPRIGEDCLVVQPLPGSSSLVGLAWFEIKPKSGAVLNSGKYVISFSEKGSPSVRARSELYVDGGEPE